MASSNRLSFLMIAAAIDLVAVGVLVDHALRQSDQQRQATTVVGTLVDLHEHLGVTCALPVAERAKAQRVFALDTAAGLVILDRSDDPGAIGDRVRATGDLYDRAGVKYMVIGVVVPDEQKNVCE